MNRRFHVAAASAIFLLSGCSEDSATLPPAGRQAASATQTPVTPPPPPASSPDAPAAPPKSTQGSDATVAEFLGFTAPKPPVWLWHPPETRLRAANYVVPATSGGDQAHVVVFSGIGGGKEANIARWRQQFRDTDHTPVEAHVSEIEADGIPITLVELQGERMKMGDGWYTPNQLLLAAIVHAPEGDIHIMFQGRYETVHANREVFLSFVEGLERQRDG
jgi:hypothetical protein